MTTIIIPTYNEIDSLPTFMQQLQTVQEQQYQQHGHFWNVLFVDDSSPDGTGQAIDELVATHDHIDVLHRQEKTGLGTAYMDGMRQALAAGADIVVQMDVDGSHRPQDVPSLLQALANADVAIGSRYVRGGQTSGWSKKREMLSRFSAKYVSTIVPLPLHDPMGGFKAWRADTLQQVLPTVQVNGYLFQAATNMAASAQGATMVEVPIVFMERAAGSSKMSGGVIREAAVGTWQLRKQRQSIR